MYETAADLARENETISHFCKLYPGAKAVKLPRRTHADFAIVKNGKTVLWIEVKERFIPSIQHKTYWIGESRLIRLIESSHRERVQALLMVKWSDGKVGIIDPQTALDNATIKVGGRRDRNDARDIERMAEFPVSLFRFL